jgi:hypothetical protein
MSRLEGIKFRLERVRTGAFGSIRRLNAHAAEDIHFLLSEVERLKKELSDSLGVYKARCDRHSDLHSWLEDALKVVAAAAPLMRPLAMYEFESVVGNIRKQTEVYFSRHSSKKEEGL